MDFERSTTAAIGYLRDLHAMFGDWNAALAAYNCGEGRVLRTINSQANPYMDDFWDLYVRLPQETARYVPRFHAVMAVMQDPAKYGFELPTPEPPIAFDTLMVDRQIKLTDLAQRTGIQPEVMTRLNAELRTGITPQYPYRLRVPVGTLDSVTAVVNNVPATSAPNLPDLITHTVKRGETIGSIARKYRTTVKTIRQENGLRRNRVRVGQVLRVPVRSRRAVSDAPRTASVSSSSRRRSTERAASGTTYVVRSGDTLWSISQRYSMSVDELRRLNGMRRTSAIRPGQRLVVSATSN
jgi:membrane-bound lytic murein transglycosylase D